MGGEEVGKGGDREGRAGAAGGDIWDVEHGAGYKVDEHGEGYKVD